MDVRFVRIFVTVIVVPELVEVFVAAMGVVTLAEGVVEIVAGIVEDPSKILVFVQRPAAVVVELMFEGHVDEEELTRAASVVAADPRTLSRN
jgi:hypothetical protein